MVNMYTTVDKIELSMESLEVLQATIGFLKDYRPDRLEMYQAVGKADVMYTVTVDSRAKGTGVLYRHIMVLKHNGRDLVLDECGVFRRVYDKETGEVSFKEEETAS